MADIRGNRTLAGTHGDLWIGGEKVFELKKIELKITANRSDIQLGIDVDSKVTGLKGELTIGIYKVYTRGYETLRSLAAGNDERMQLIANLADPDAVGKQEERYSVDNCWLNDLPLVGWEKGQPIEQEFTGGFTPSDMINLDRINA